MDWQEFLKGESGIRGLSSEQTETLLAALFSPEKAPLNQTQLSAHLKIEKPTVKQRLGEIYNKFSASFPELANQQGAGKLNILHTQLKQKYYQVSQPVVANQVSKLSPYPEEFRSLIEEKIRTFCGRQFVFEAFKQFITTNPCGYFTIIGDAGMGKSSIAAKYASEHKSPCYFNILVERRNRPELFLKSIRRQLIDRYQLPNSEDADLPSLLAKVAGKLTFGDRLVIVVDALDEVEQEPGENLLHLPTTLPNNVYFLLTRRPYNLGKKRLSVSPGVLVQELDLRDEKYVNDNQHDIKGYIQFVINNDSDYKNGLRNWIQTRSIADTTFVEQLTSKSENNFMYLRYVLPAIANGDYNDLDLKELPDGLPEYYQNHWVRMGMEAKPGQLMEIVLYILLEIGTPIDCEMIAGIAKEDKCDVEAVLDEWVEYLKKQKVDGQICYTIYHASFLDFLKAKREMDSKRKIFNEVNQRIAEYLEKGME
ncbi:NACHT domain-containing protein [Microcoleus sp. CAWBG58]|uniref:NACHT domain-containing protein n=1 Tax=Microcoleus sp. CAWBG58 TaxID=2841651 RepID=UPI0025EE7B53|nr:NACHT domain-containing protein [Microcoleus sp. CAWBG58]